MDISLLITMIAFMESGLFLFYIKSYYNTELDRVVVFIACLCLFSLAGFIGIILNSFPLFIIFRIFAGLIIINFCYQGGIKRKLIKSTLFFLLRFMADLAIMMFTCVYNHMETIQELSYASFSMKIGCLSLSGMLSFLLTCCYLNISNSSDENMLSVSILYYPIVVSALVLAFFRNVMIDIISFSLGFRQIRIISVLIILMLFGIYCLMWIYSKKLAEVLFKEKELSRVSYDLQYYKLLDEQNNKLMTLIHDEKKHFQIIKSISFQKDVKKYIDDIYEDIQTVSFFGKTKNKYLDLLINKYKESTEEKGIIFNVAANVADFSFLDPPDLISLFSNLLDNAMRAAEESREKYIDLTINHFQGFNTVRCTNSSEQIPVYKGKIILSTKKDKGIHGYGMKRIGYILNKYNGEYTWEYNEDLKQFSVYITFFRKSL